MAALSNLQELWLGKNQLGYLPVELTKLPKLNKLDLWHNHLTAFDTAWAKAPSLQWIDLRLNMIDTPLQVKLKQLFKGRKIYFSKNCNCGG